MKTVGYTEAGVKHFTITHEGYNYDCRRRGQMFECNGVIAPLKKHKSNIEHGMYGIPVAVTQEALDAERGDDDGPDVPTGTWDCVDPCAFLAAIILEGSMPPAELRGRIMETLDNYGWTNESGDKVDAGRVEREFKRFNLLTNKV